MDDTSAVHIHTARPEQVDQAEKTLLDQVELARATTFKFPKDRELYVAAHIFLRQTLSQYAPVSPADWQFDTNAYGKPFIINSGYQWLQFNLSHTQGLIACAVSHGLPVGVDVERCKPLSDLDALCRYTLSPLEAYDVLSISNTEQRARRFFTYWTLKEAYIKARGIGLSLPLQQFTFVQDENLTWQLYTDETTVPDNSRSWQFDTEIIGQHYLSIGAQNTKLVNTHELTFSIFTGS
ncbi:4'-phosphopantetheinyl transferase superfamily protein [Thiothrix litoralis]|jgi:4'-phosphopantetheinyl transferase|uniref:4'-phosphopantetheinyl transferase superfamily protein n=1 Tax=Thiothrix litoralis TaxID=2891210 RepID=A0ABX7WPQ2_9GAMM|nr:4'-phosphopantetheinyl transferase superfamily protein [Thiothrix litoralis]QTR45470.1 4'-phosphopantetheinyl transferase superfamily protein [Thiothrix litoralis]